MKQVSELLEQLFTNRRAMDLQFNSRFPMPNYKSVHGQDTELPSSSKCSQQFPVGSIKYFKIMISKIT